MNSRRFTLVELLIVIGIIAILAGILLPVLSGAGKRADMTRAKADITTLINAIKQFEATYGHLPVRANNVNHNDEKYPFGKENDGTYTPGDQYKDLILVLQGEEPEHNTFGNSHYNPNTRKIRFLDIVNNRPGHFNDPWSEEEDGRYQVYMDTNYDGKIKGTGISGLNVPEISGEYTLYYSIVVFSKGALKDDSSAKEIQNDNVYSFPVVWDKANNRYDFEK